MNYLTKKITSDLFLLRLAQHYERKSHAIVFPEIPCLTNIGYCPLIDQPSTEYNTEYTACSADQCKRRTVSDCDNIRPSHLCQGKVYTILRIGGFQIALNFLSIIGKKYQSSGLEDLLI